MTIIRTVHNRENPYVLVNKSVIQDQNLSLRARGLWAYCLSFPSNWKFHIKHLISQCIEGRTVIYSIIEELIKYNLVLRMEYYERGENGKMIGGGVEYIFFEFPATEQEKDEHVEEFKKSFRRSGFRNTGYRHSEDQPLLNTVSIQNTEVDDDEGEHPPKCGKDVHNSVLMKDDLYLFALKKDWTSEEIEYAYEKFSCVKTPISDKFAYIETIINNKRIVGKSKPEAKKCKKTMYKYSDTSTSQSSKSETTKEAPLANDMSELPSLNLDLAWREHARLKAISRAQKIS